MLIGSGKFLFGQILIVSLFLVLSVAGAAFAIYLFAVANSLYLYSLATMMMLLSLIAGFFNIVASLWYYRSFRYGSYLKVMQEKLKPLRRYPSVAVAIPVFNEDSDMVEKNVSEFKKMNYPLGKMKFYLLDDSTDPTIEKQMMQIAERHGMRYLHRDERKGFKAGAYNNMLKIAKEEYLAVFDSDEFLVNKDFILDTLPYFQDPNVSYVQTEKRYAKGSFFSDSVDIFDAFFFRFIQPARAMNNTAIFGGSCGMIKMSVLKGLGGFPEYVIEDTFFSFESDMHHYRSIYLPEIYALGRPVKTFTELVKQQWRYNYGDTQFMKYFFKRKGFTKANPLSSVEYTAHGLGLNYLSIILILFTLVSVGIVFTSIPFEHIPSVTGFIYHNSWGVDLELLGFFAFTLSLLTPVILTRIYFKSWSKGIMIFLLNYALAFVRAKAAIAALFGKVNPGLNWNRLKTMQSVSRNLRTSISNTRAEIVFSTSMFALASFAFLETNLAGGIWLVWYGILYILSTLFLLRYG